MYNISVSPHIRSEFSTRTAMRDVLLALLPTTAIGIWVHGWHGALVIALAVAAAVLSEYVFDLITRKKNTVSDLSAAVTGLLLALTLPARVPFYVPVLGSFFAVIVAKCLFGGLGKNIFNPALAGRSFLLISFGAAMTSYSGIDAVTSATPLAQLASGEAVDLYAMALGTASGVIGSSAFGLLAGGIYLLLKKGITWEIPVSMICTTALMVAFFGGHGWDLSYLLPQIFGGGLLMAAFFMATEPVTCPSTTKGQLLYGIFAGFLCGLFRVKGSSADSTTYAILISNMFGNLIDDVIVPVPYAYHIQRERKFSIPKPVIVLTAITLIAGAALSGVYMLTKDQIAMNQERANKAAWQEVCPDAADFAHDSALDAAASDSDYGDCTIDSVLVGQDADGNAAGYVITVTSNAAYDGDLTLVVGLKEDGTVNSISFTSLHDTAGMGMLCGEDAFKSQFDGVKVSSFTLNKSGTSTEEDVIDSVSGASTTSGAVVNAVNAALDFYAKNIQ